MKLCVISDTHNQLPKIDPVDILIHAGDFTLSGRSDEHKEFMQAFSEMPATYKYFILGNHDMSFLDRKRENLKTCEKLGIIFAPGYAYHKGLSISFLHWDNAYYNYGFHKWIGSHFLKERQKIYNTIREQTRILVTHHPAYLTLDKVQTPRLGEDAHVGCHILQKHLYELPDIEYHLHGHIHEAYGRSIHNDITSINASQLDRSYNLVNPPIYLEL